jgi:membrane-associated protease RseP (regulator of RpoE activity)
VNDFPAGPASPAPGSGLSYDPASGAHVWRPHRRFQHRRWLHIVLVLATLLTTTFSGALVYAGFEATAGLTPNLEILSLRFQLPGLWYAIPVVLILGAHELGHYWLCRVHNVDATLPYFIPAPPPVITGTFGAVIRIREAFPNKRALFDIGVAGPIGGFLMLLPFLFWGVSLSQVVPISPSEDMIYFGEPLLYQLAAWLHFGAIPDGYDVTLHPMAFAAWWGMLATALNLMPFGQLDGGHIVYSLVKRHRHGAIVSAATLVAAALLTIYSTSWIVTFVMMMVMAVFLGLHHPAVVDDTTPLDAKRRWIALFALIMFVVCFTPVPIQSFIAK